MMVWELLESMSKTCVATVSWSSKVVTLVQDPAYDF